MKRARLLVDYSGSEDEKETDTRNDSTQSEPQRQKKKLPVLSEKLTIAVPKSDLAAHQGRIRTRPHVDGQYAAYVYITIHPEREAAFSAFVTSAAKRAKNIVPCLHSAYLKEDKAFAVGEVPPSGAHNRSASNDELHISLSRPIYLRSYQREDLKRSVKAIADSHKSFKASFTSFATFDNDERTRTFLGLEVGAGHLEMLALSNALNHVLELLHQDAFYLEPRFHTSFAWALLRPKALDQDKNHNIAEDANFPSISTFPPTLIPILSVELKNSFRTVATFDVTDLSVKVGKDVSTFPFLP